jgi:formylglycine-generating enzyme required for sulfatase activity
MNSAPANTQALPPGTRLEEFLIERVLGSGGFGITYLARDTRLGRRVVIKENLPVQFAYRHPESLTVSPRHTTGDDADNFAWSLENFSKEAATLASLDHPGIVKVHRSFEAYGTAYFAMPFVEGLALDALVESRKAEGNGFEEAELRGLLEHLLDALSDLHGHETYHRDIKPGNILITRKGLPVLIDFGSARQRLSERSMTVIESPGYTPFEQLQSRGNVGPWSDLYALGATLAKVITGETPPKATDRAFDDPFTPLHTRPNLLDRYSTAFLTHLDRALHMRPAERWQDAREWGGALLSPTPSPAILTNVATPSPPHASEPQPGEERDFPLTENAAIRMCWIPPGEVLMGSPQIELGRDRNELQHGVIITQGFWLAKYPLTQLLWRAVMGNAPHIFKGDDLPAESVSWNDIFGDDERNSGFLSLANDHAPPDFRFDLPTEAQWEYACRGRVKAPHYTGTTLVSTMAACRNLEPLAWYLSNSNGRTHPVGAKKPNSWGLHDMLGNVWEWCRDWYGDYPNKISHNPQGPPSGSNRVARGGSWTSVPKYCRAASRLKIPPTYRNSHVGFRLALVASEDA